MDLKPRLHMKMQQQLVMTPRLQMALKILQVSTLELEQFLKQELLQNPLLDRVEEEESELDKSDGEQDAREEREEEAGREEEREERRADEGAEREAEKEQPEAAPESPTDDLDWDDYLDDVYSHAYGQNFARDDDDERYERVPVAVVTFEDELKHQLHMECTDESLIGIAEYIIDELDADGYVNDPLAEIAHALKTDVPIVERALAVVQSLEPPGIAARSIEECLLLQLNRKGLSDSLAGRVVSTSFEELKSCKYEAIRKRLAVTTEELREAIGEIAKLDPRPRIDPVVGDPGYITPDLVVDEIDGEFVVFLNDQDVPRVRINPTYRRILTSDTDGEEREFISKKLKAARWIVQSIENRRRTMVRVMESIVRAQKPFFKKGVSALKPLTLQQIADDVSMHESTVSRVTRGKYVQTPRGTFELKYFFSSGIRTSDGSEIASKAVRDAMKEIISKEDKKRPLSDQKLAEELKRMGFRISRRAVAKYREQMKILRAGLRKEI
ncbi:MAG: RNA polymerase factor sigma-54 [Candidatus Eisenbacteria bacterium]|nr:RNA polymerase factor sigma-54 [Candidatus Eisenbacteria bacterium]